MPPPTALTREEWPYLLAWMGNYLGYAPDQEINPAIVIKPFVPPKPVVTREQFQAIRNYYLENAPTFAELAPPAAKPPVTPLFQPVPFAIEGNVVSLVAFDPPNQALVVGLSRPPSLLILQRGITTPIAVPSEPVAFERLNQVCRFTLIGHLGYDARQGQIVDFDMQAGTRHIRVDKYPRIAAHRTADLDRDGREDVLVCGFGEDPSGRVAIWWDAAGAASEQVLFEEAGTTWGDVADFDGDGDLDIVLLVANGRPRILVFENEGGRRFEPRPILDRPVGWGFNRGLVIDWDNDGKPDLVEATGNNLELRGRPVKAHHGIRVLRNEGDWKFKEVMFERLDGAMDVAAGDFDGNGRIDLAAVGFYPDWRLPVPTTFLLLLQQADGRVERSGLDDRNWNRWMRVATGDADGDGDTDILIGAAQVPAGIPAEHTARYQQLMEGQACLMLLRNLSKANLPTAPPQ